MKQLKILFFSVEHVEYDNPEYYILYEQQPALKKFVEVAGRVKNTRLVAHTYEGSEVVLSQVLDSPY